MNRKIIYVKFKDKESKLYQYIRQSKENQAQNIQ